MGFFEFDNESFEAATSTRRNGRMVASAALREVELFFEELTGDAPQTAAPTTSAPAVAPASAAPVAGNSPGHVWARRIYDEIARQGPPPGMAVSGASNGSRWTIVALPGSTTPRASVRSGDLVVKRALGEGRLVSLLVADATIQARELFGPDGLVRADTLVLRADTGVPAALRPGSTPLAPGPREGEYAESDAETVPTFAVGAADPRVREFIELPAHVEDWIPNAAGTGLVVVQFACRTQTELDAIVPSAAGDIGSTPTPLWRSNAASRLEAALDLLVFHPATAAGATTLPAGRHPLAIVCMGNHDAVEGGTEVFSHQGYSGFSASPPAVATGAYLQEALAEKGIISVSVSTNPANLLNLLLETRARLVVAALRRMQQLDGDATSRYHRRIDFQRVALIGHSRGGDAVVRAVKLAPANIRVRAVVQLAPTDMTGLLQGAAPTGLPIPVGAPAPTFVKRPVTLPASSGPRQLIVWGSRDGDVSGAQDVRADVSVNPFRHYDRSSVERAFQFWHGATHNRFNRLWTDAHEDGDCLSRTSVAAGLLSRPDQEARTVEMVRGWLLFSLYDEVAEAGRFDGRTRTAIATALPISAMWKFGGRLATIDQFDDVRPDRNTLGGANVTPATGVFDEITLANENGEGAGITAYQFPHIDRALRSSPAPLPTLGPTVPGLPTTVTPPVWRTTIPAGSRDFRRFHLVTFRVTKKYDPARLAAGTAVLPTVRVRLIGPTATVRHTEAAVGRLSSLPILRLLPVSAGCPTPARDLTKVHYETWEVDLAKFAAAMSIADVRFVELEIDTDVGQPVYIDTLSLVKRP